MNLEALKTAATSKMARQVLLTQKHSPAILLVAGTVGVVGTVVLACRATLKVSDVLDEAEKRSAEEKRIHAQVDGTAYTDENLAKSLRTIQIQTAMKITKPYLPALALGVVSIAALTGSHIILSKRNTGLMAAYAAIDQAYNRYRGNVVEKFGEDEDRNLAGITRPVNVEEKTADGKTKIEKSLRLGDRNASPYAALFDEKSKHFTVEPGMNPLVIGMIAQHMNELLRARGHVFLNEVYDRLDLPRTPAGAVVGWLYRKDNEEKTGDNYISFGLWDGPIDDANAFVDGEELSVWLDFNVDGVIYDKI